MSFGYLMKEGGYTVNKLVLFFIDSFAGPRKLELLFCENMWVALRSTGIKENTILVLS
jgi:hypothetical protein